MDNFQDLQLGSTAPLVRFEVNSPWHSSNRLPPGNDQTFHTLTFDSESPCVHLNIMIPQIYSAHPI